MLFHHWSGLLTAVVSRVSWLPEHASGDGTGVEVDGGGVDDDPVQQHTLSPQGAEGKK